MIESSPNSSLENLLLMATPEFNSEIDALVKSRHPLLYLTAKEEPRVIKYFKYFCEANGYTGYIWDSYLGARAINGQPGQCSEDNLDAEGILDHIIASVENGVSSLNQVKEFSIFLLLDFHKFLEIASPDIERRIKVISQKNRNSITTIIVAPHFVSDAVIDDQFAVLDFPYPNNAEIEIVLNNVLHSVEDRIPNIIEDTYIDKEDIVRASCGLSVDDIQSAYAKSLVKYKKIDVGTIIKEKQQKIKKTGILEYYDQKVKLDEVGGLKNLTNWLQVRKLAFRDTAKEYGLDTPRGVLVMGVPGTGKSLTCKAIASEYAMPLLRLDFGKMFHSYVGESERAMRESLLLAEAVSPCILWIDEIDKGLSGGQSSSQTDGGTTNRVIGTFLTWMQEKTKPVFIVCTANNQEQIPTEFMRAGRFDEIFFVDLPSEEERKEIFNILLTKKKRDPKKYNINMLAYRSKYYTGAEIEKAINMAMFSAFKDSAREFSTEDICESLTQFKTLYDMRQDKIKLMRDWASRRCILANSSPVKEWEEAPVSRIKNILLDEQD